MSRIVIEVYRGIVANVYSDDKETVVEVIDDDTQDEEIEAENKQELEAVQSILHKVY